MQELAILDFGSQYTHLIARRVRELGVVSHIYSNDTPSDQLQNAAGIILSGGPRSVVSDPPLAYDPALFDLGVPILGLCYGHQLIAQHFGGRVAKGSAREYGLTTLSLYHPITLSPMFNGVPAETIVWMSHGDHVERLPDGFVSIGKTDRDANTAVVNEGKKIYGFQFHPEVHHTKAGKQMLHNFVFRICGAAKNWDAADMLREVEENIRVEAENKKVFLLMSGGVDSTVCFGLLEKTLGSDRVYGLHIDHGFMRKNESRQVKEALAGIGLNNLHVCNAEDEFLGALTGVVDPERKRQIIGDLFLDITERVMAELGLNEKEWLLGQGTIYPDTIESGGTKNADKIKTHHNRVDRVQKLISAGLVIEPLKDLYKDEVRTLGRTLGLPDSLVNRHPFPGPGLAIRCLCSNESGDTPAVIPSVTRNPQWAPGDHSVMPRDDWQLIRLPIKSVGVQGDERSYAHPAVILNPPPTRGRRGGGYDWPTLHTLSPAITNEHKDINRVLFTIYGDESKLSVSRLKPATLTKDRLELLRELDARINAIVNAHPETKHVWQMPIVLIPFGYDKGESLVIRPVESEEAMTVKFAEFPEELLKILHSEFCILNSVDYLFYDLTNKPPGTIEWE